jgi:hypothetical protein
MALAPGGPQAQFNQNPRITQEQIDQAAQLEAAKTMQETLASVVAEIPLYYRAEATGVSNHLGGYVRFNPSSAGPTWDVEQWHFIP